jgi:murein L,D-transpeptidase YafK
VIIQPGNLAYDQAVAASLKNRSTLVVVDKLSHELRLYKDGKLRSTFVAEFGPNWIGDKNHQGDQATPEGSYHVVKKKERRQTRYYKALLLNYPNKDDMQRYRNNVKNGVIPSH